MTKTDAHHTPGPWEAVATVSSSRKHIFGRAKNKEYYVGTLVSGSREDLAIFRANFRLIAAAPDMHDALVCPELEKAHELDRKNKAHSFLRILPGTRQQNTMRLTSLSIGDPGLPPTC